MSKVDAIAAAHARSRVNGFGYAYAICWQNGDWTVADRKPSLRAYGVSCIECEDGRERIA